MDFILSLIPGGGLTAVVAAVLAALAGVWRVYASGKAAGRSEQKAKEADSYAKHIRDVTRAADARPRGSVSDDPHNRDRR